MERLKKLENLQSCPKKWQTYDIFFFNYNLLKFLVLIPKF